MGYALKVDEQWPVSGAGFCRAGMLIDGQYRDAAISAPRPVHREFEEVQLAGITISFDVSRSGGEVPDVVRQSLERLAELADRKVGWDSYGSARLDRAVIRPAVHLIVDGFGPCLYPDMSLTSVGGLNLSWECDDGRELEIELLPDGTCDYSYVHGDEDLAPDAPVSLDEVRSLLSKLRN